MPAGTLTLGALALNAAALLCHLQAWRRRGNPRTRRFIAGLALALAALTLWWRAAGVEIGTVYWCGVTALTAWCAVAAGAERGRGDAPERPFRVRPGDARSLLSGSGTALLAGPLALGAASLAALWIAHTMPLQPANAWIVAAFALPLIWTALVVIVLRSRRRMRCAIWCLGTNLAGALLLYATRAT